MKKIINILLIFLSILIFPLVAAAQNTAVRGFVYEAETGEPAIFANAQLKGTTYGASTDVNGYFMISQIPAGKYTLLITYLGFDTIKMAINIKNGEIINKKFYLKKPRS